jgi:hypothetical protein
MISSTKGVPVIMQLAVTLALALTLAQAQANGLAVTNVCATHGTLGPLRSDLRILPGDTLCLEFGIEGITVAPDGKVLYSTSLEVVDGKDNVIYRQNPTDQEALASLGGKSVPGLAQLQIGSDHPAGDFTLKVAITDRASKQTQAITQKVQVLPPGFGIVQLKVTGDPEGVVPAGPAGVGDSLWVTFAVVKFGRDSATQQPHVQFEMRILDENNKTTVAKAQTGVINRDVAASDKLLGGQFLIWANRPGNFVLELQAVDKVAGKSCALSFPLTVRARR